MAPTLTLHQGDAQAEFVEHPMETARRAIMAAAEVEDDEWRSLLRRVGLSLPRRDPIKREGGDGLPFLAALCGDRVESGPSGWNTPRSSAPNRHGREV